MNTLYLDTRDNKRIVVCLKTEKKEYREESVSNIGKAQTILPIIVKVLKLAKMDAKDIDEIEVERGPGSFTGLRVGVAIANALSFGNHIKINGKKIGTIELPKY